MSGKTSSILLMANSVALLNMFIPIASPDLATNLSRKNILRFCSVIVLFFCLPDIEHPASNSCVEPLKSGKP